MRTPLRVAKVKVVPGMCVCLSQGVLDALTFSCAQDPSPKA